MISEIKGKKEGLQLPTTRKLLDKLTQHPEEEEKEIEEIERETDALQTYLRYIANRNHPHAAFVTVRHQHGKHLEGWHNVMYRLISQELPTTNLDHLNDRQIETLERCLEEMPDDEYEPSPNQHDYPFVMGAGLTNRVPAATANAPTLENSERVANDVADQTNRGERQPGSDQRATSTDKTTVVRPMESSFERAQRVRGTAYKPPNHVMDDLKNEDTVGDEHTTNPLPESNNNECSNLPIHPDPVRKQLERIQQLSGGSQGHVFGWLRDRLTPEEARLLYGVRESVGASTTDAEAVNVLTRGLNQIAESLFSEQRTKEEDPAASASKGSLNSLRKREANLVFVARDCDRHQVMTCPTETDRKLAEGYRKAAETKLEDLQALGLGSPPNNQRFWSWAKMALGGRTREGGPPENLTVADFPKVKPQGWDDYRPPTDRKLEKRPEAPKTMSEWKKHAMRFAWESACVYGMEYYEWLHDTISRMEYTNEEDEEKYPEYVLWDAFGEMNLAFSEWLENLYRGLCLRLGHDHPEKDELKFAALTPMPGTGQYAFQVPNVWSVDDPRMPWKKKILPRIERLKHRTTWRRTYAELPKDRRVGGEEEEFYRPPPVQQPIPPSPPDPNDNAKGSEEDKVGGGKTGRGGKAGKGKGGKGGKGDQASNDGKANQGSPKAPGDTLPKRGRLAGPSLKGCEYRVSRAKAPTHRGKIICWDNACHTGCPLPADKTPAAHVPVEHPEKCHEAVQLQFFRRRGVAQRKKMTDDQIAAGFKRLGEKMQKEWEANKEKEKSKKVGEGDSPTVPPFADQEADGTGLTGSGGAIRPHWHPPAEYTSFDPTVLERTLIEMVSGPARAGLQNHSAPAEFEEKQGEHTVPRAQRREALIAEMDQDTDLQVKLKTATKYLGQYLHARVLNGLEV